MVSAHHAPWRWCLALNACLPALKYCEVTQLMHTLSLTAVSTSCCGGACRRAVTHRIAASSLPPPCLSPPPRQTQSANKIAQSANKIARRGSRRLAPPTPRSCCRFVPPTRLKSSLPRDARAPPYSTSHCTPTAASHCPPSSATSL